MCCNISNNNHVTDSVAVVSNLFTVSMTTVETECKQISFTVERTLSFHVLRFLSPYDFCEDFPRLNLVLNVI